MIVFVEEAAGTVASADAQVRDGGRVGDRLGEWAQRPGVGNASMGPARVVVPFVFAEGVERWVWFQIRVRSSSSCGAVALADRWARLARDPADGQIARASSLNAAATRSPGEASSPVRSVRGEDSGRTRARR